MAIIRESKKTFDELNSTYAIEDLNANFPFVMMFVCSVIDLLDFVIFLTVEIVVVVVIWWIFTMLIFTPILIVYINYREKKFSVQGIVADYKKRNNLATTRSIARQSNKLVRSSEALSKAGKLEEASAEMAKAAQLLEKMPKWLRWIFITCENIPLIEVLPVNSIMLGLSYLDNRDTVKLVKEKAESLAKRQDVKIIRSYVSDRISGSSS